MKNKLNKKEILKEKYKSFSEHKEIKDKINNNEKSLIVILLF